MNRIGALICCLQAVSCWSCSLVSAYGQFTYERTKSFGFLSQSGASPMANPIEGSDGALYGTTQFGGRENGTVFRMNKDGSGYAVLKAFIGGDDGAQPQAALLRSADRRL